MDPKHLGLGSNFDDFLREEGLLEEAEAVAAGRILAERLADGSSNDELDALDERHPDLLPEHRDRVAATLAEPDEVRRSLRFESARLFSRWFSDLHEGKHVVVVVNRDPPPHVRHWIMTAYIARKLTPGESEWNRT